ncbi:MAG: Regulatory protein RecX [Candidatus Marinimicrobia bacterium]|nr:Regulatory protein RecX [Candidatus Neomarinimicrobiota bacterium]
MEITKIEQQKKNKSRYSIFVDGDYVVGVHESVLFNEHLHVGDKITKEKISELESADARYAAKDAAFHLLKYRQRSVEEMRSRLLNKDFSNDVVAEVIDELRIDEYLNDEKFAMTYAEDQVARKNIGPIRLKAELRKKQLPDKIIEKTVTQIYQKHDALELARDAAEKKKHSLRKVDYETAYRRLTSYLGRRGFSWDIINEVVDLEEWR